MDNVLTVGYPEFVCCDDAACTGSCQKIHLAPEFDPEETQELEIPVVWEPADSL